MEAGKRISRASREYGVHPNMLRAWKQLFSQYGEKAFAGNGHAYAEQERIAELEELISAREHEIQALRTALQSITSSDLPVDVKDLSIPLRVTWPTQAASQG
jgi:transposase-like protein